MPKLPRKTRADILNDMLYASVIEGELDLVELAIETGATMHRDNIDELIKANLLNENPKIQALLLEKGSKPSIDVICFGVGLIRTEEVAEEPVKALIPYTDWDNIESIILLMLAVMIKPDKLLLEEVSRYFDFKTCIVSNNYWIGRIFDYLRVDTEYPELMALLDSLPTERFALSHDLDIERQITRKLLKNKQYTVLAYLNERGALAQGLHFDAYFSKAAVEIADMQDAGYPVTCEWDMRVLTGDKTRMEYLFNPRPEKQALLAAQLRFMTPPKRQKMSVYHDEIENLIGHYRHRKPYLAAPLMNVLLTLIDKGYLKGMQLDFVKLWGFSPHDEDDNDTAFFIHFLHSNERCWQYLHSNEVEISGVDVDNLLSLSLDFDAACKWLSECAPDDALFAEIEEILLSDRAYIEAKYRDEYSALFKLFRWNIERQANTEVIKNGIWREITSGYEGFVELWDDIGPSLTNASHQDNLSGSVLVSVYASPIKLMAESMAPIAKKRHWRLICEIASHSPLELLAYVPQESQARGHLLALLAESGNDSATA